MIGDTVWPEVKMGDVCEEITVGFVGPMTAEYRDAGVPFLRSMNIEPFCINKTDLKYVSPEFHARISKSRLRAGDVVIVRTGAPGTAAVVPEWMHNGNCSDLVIARPGPGVDAQFLCYYVNAVTHHIVNEHVVGAVQQHFNVGAAKSLKLPLPPLPEQRSIARVLGGLDDKIELNRRMNRTLEDLARGLFRSWFVDFDPVTKNGNGRAPATPAGLFPKRLVDSPIGPIPEGWRVGTVGAEFNLTMGQSPPGSTYNEDGAGVPFYQGRTDFGFRFPTRRVYCTAPTRFAEPGDTLVSVRAPVGDINLADERCAAGRGVAAVRHKSGATSYTYAMMASQREAFDVFNGDGTLFGCIGKADFDKMAVLVPPPATVDAFERIAGPWDAQIAVNEKEARSLAATRDALFPQLLSGEIRLNHAEAAAQEVLA
jgi:type I restriction enzyme S subunit